MIYLFYALIALTSAEQKTFGGQTFEILRLDPKKVELKLYWRRADGTPYANLRELRAAVGPGFLMATNSGIYDREYRPLGLHVERGVQMRPLNQARGSGGNFSMVPNGVFLLTRNGARVVETSEYKGVTEPVLEATQSGPLLVHAGEIHPEFTKGSENKKLRSGVGVDAKGQVVFAISAGAVSFYDFAEFFRAELKCPNALYLDGTISELLIKDAEPGDALVPFVGMWAAKDAATARADKNRNDR